MLDLKPLHCERQTSLRRDRKPTLANRFLEGALDCWPHDVSRVAASRKSSTSQLTDAAFAGVLADKQTYDDVFVHSFGSVNYEERSGRWISISFLTRPGLPRPTAISKGATEQLFFVESGLFLGLYALGGAHPCNWMVSGLR